MGRDMALAHCFGFERVCCIFDLGTATSLVWLWFLVASSSNICLVAQLLCFGFSRELCRSNVVSLDLWCNFFALVWCGFFGAVCDNLTRGNLLISPVFGFGIWYL